MHIQIVESFTYQLYLSKLFLALSSCAVPHSLEGKSAIGHGQRASRLTPAVVNGLR